jgi:hypothetical protein
LVDLDSQLDRDRRARLIWGLVKTLDLSALDAAVRARDDVAGRRPRFRGWWWRCGSMPSPTGSARPALIDEGLLTLDEVIIDGTKVEALAGRGSMVQKPKLDKLAAAVGERVAELKRELESDGAAVVKAWRERMASEAGKVVYRRRKLTEHAHAKMKDDGFGRMLVHGKAVVRNVCLMHALVQNLMNARFLRQAAVA